MATSPAQQTSGLHTAKRPVWLRHWGSNQSRSQGQLRGLWSVKRTWNFQRVCENSLCLKNSETIDLTSIVIFAFPPQRASETLGTPRNVDEFVRRHTALATRFGLHKSLGTEAVDAFELGRMWSPIGFTLAELVGEPDGFPLTDGIEIGSDLGEGAPIILTAQRVKEISHSLSAHPDISTFMSSKTFQEEILAPGEWENMNVKDREAFRTVFAGLRSFFGEAADSGSVFLVVTY